ncbi:hypothetical protein EPR50_G00122880 [Perca flavescens]|uniref:SEA domain-containing protein n=1 Tax=Perca flavescens TaxID=8167 RepID=A0A484CPF1_PERFV|nr:hypothetical protein EPR50_G00122880 [Perca flavescens]
MLTNSFLVLIAGTTLTDTRTTLDTTSVTSSPADTHIVAIDLKAYVLSQNGENEDVIFEAISNFISQTLHQLNCEGCSSTIRQIKRT